MSKRIFNRMLLISVITFLASAILFLGVLYEYFTRQLKTELKTEAGYIAQGVETGGESFINGLAKGENRITLIAQDGTVLYDSEADESTMNNHANREEIVEAQENGYGEASRLSSTLDVTTIYYAVRLSNGDVVRLSGTYNTIWSLVFGMLYPMCVIAFVVLIAAAILSSRISKKILEPINKLDLNSPDIDDDYEEFGPLLTKINNQNKMVSMQMAQLKRRQEEFKTISENMSEGLLMIDCKKELLSYNSAALHLLGAKAPNENLSVLALNRSEKFRTAIDEALEGRHSVQDLELGDMCCQIIANPVYFEDKLTGAVILIIDITEKEQHETLRREFTSNVSHELKTPLTSIYGMSELLMNPEMDKDMAADFAKSIHDETGRLIALVNDIIKLSLLDENTVPQEKEEVNLYNLVKIVVDRLKVVADKNGITLKVEGKDVYVNGVYSVLEEMVYNLCDNGIKYNKSGGSVVIYVSEENGCPVVKVSDTGIGIPEEHLDRVFERFYRVDKSHSKQIGGTGLGLSIVKHGAIYHGANVSISSQPGEGTDVTIKFPENNRNK